MKSEKQSCFERPGAKNTEIYQTPANYFKIYENAELDTLDISSLVVVGQDFEIKDNADLTCDDTALESQIAVIGDTTICHNAPGNGCGPDTCP